MKEKESSTVSAFKQSKEYITYSTYSELEFWEKFKFALQNKDEKLLCDLTKVQSLKKYPTYDHSINTLKDLSLEELNYAIPKLVNVGLSSASIFNFIIKKETADNIELAKLKNEAIVTIMKLQVQAKSLFYPFGENEYNHTNYFYKSLNIASLPQIIESIFVHKPDALLEFILTSDSTNNELAAEYVTKALNNNADINKILKNSKININLKTLNSIADSLLNHPLKPANPQLLLEKILTSPNQYKYDDNLKRSSIDKEEVKTKYDLLKKCSDRGAILTNKLTVYHDEGHAFLRIDCANCEKGEGATLYVGLYPPENAEDNQETDGKKVGHTIVNAASGFVAKHVALKQMPFVFRSLDGYLYKSGFKLNNKDSSTKPLPSSDQYHIMHEFSGSLKKESNLGDPSRSDYNEIQNMPHKSFNISEKAAEELFNRVDHLVNTCDKDLKYQIFGSNCIDFVQDMYKRAGLTGDYMDELYGFKHPQNILSTYKALRDTYQAIDAPLKAMGIEMSEVSPKQLAADIVTQVQLARALYPAAAYIGAVATGAAVSAYEYLLGSKKVTPEELNKAKESLESAKALNTFSKLKQEFDDIYRKTYTANLQIANNDYNERTYNYNTATGEKAIGKVRLMAEIKLEFENVTKELVTLIKTSKDLKQNSNQTSVDKVIAMDAKLVNSLATLAKKDLASIASNNMQLAKMQALQQQLITREERKKLNTNIHLKNKIKAVSVNARD